MATVLALDKDTLHLELLAVLLKKDHHHVHATTDPDTALGILQSKVIDLVLVEPAFPRGDGHRLCQQIRQLNPYTPLMIVSERSDEEHIIRGLATADDYVVKPYSPRQLLARVQALSRRAGLSRANRWRKEDLTVGDVELNLRQMHVVVGGKRVQLTPRELSLLHCLMTNANRVLSREQLMEQAWGENFVGSRKAVDVCIQRIRGKLERHLPQRDRILALRGFGYKFAVPNGHDDPVDNPAEPQELPPPIPAMRLPEVELAPVLATAHR